MRPSCYAASIIIAGSFIHIQHIDLGLSAKQGPSPLLLMFLISSRLLEEAVLLAKQSRLLLLLLFLHTQETRVKWLGSSCWAGSIVLLVHCCDSPHIYKQDGPRLLAGQGPVLCCRFPHVRRVHSSCCSLTSHWKDFEAKIKLLHNWHCDFQVQRPFIVRTHLHDEKCVKYNGFWLVWVWKH